VYSEGLLTSSGSVEESVSYTGIAFPEATVLVSVGVCLGIGVIANTLHALRQATLVLVRLGGHCRTRVEMLIPNHPETNDPS
jgi:hypothetical protein